jgi:hypothetical protein
METIDEAARQAKPIIVIDPDGQASLRWCGDFELPLPVQRASELSAKPVDEAALQTLVNRLPRPPEWRGVFADYERDSEVCGLRDYLATPTDRTCWHAGWKILQFALGAKLLRHNAKPESPPPSQTYERGLALGINEKTASALKEALTAADNVALHFSQAFRTNFIVSFVFGASALCRVAATFVSDEQFRWAATEFFASYWS